MILQEKLEEMVEESVKNILIFSAEGIGKVSFSDITENTKKVMNTLGTKILSLIVNQVEDSFEKTRDRHKIVVRNKNKKRRLLTEMGEVEIKRTLYCDKRLGRYFFAVDEILQLEKHSRIERGMKAKLVSDAAITSYGKAATLANNTVSRQTIHNLVKSLDKIEAPYVKTNRNAPNIYIEADEDHIHLNTGKPGEVKLVYVHEGRDNTKGRTELVNPRYFTSAQGDDIWDNVADYLIDNYRCIKANIHLSGDGASWIRNGVYILPRIDYSLDKFHLHRALLTLSRGNMGLLRKLTDSAYNGEEEEFRRLCQQNNISGKELQKLQLYITSNMEYISDESRCSAESHVSHVLSARMSSRPMGWSVSGADRMAKLRAYLFNKGDFRLLFEGSYRKNKLIQTSKKRQNDVSTAPSVNRGYRDIIYYIPGIEKVTGHFSTAIKYLLKIK